MICQEKMLEFIGFVGFIEFVEWIEFVAFSGLFNPINSTTQSFVMKTISLISMLKIHGLPVYLFTYRGCNRYTVTCKKILINSSGIVYTGISVFIYLPVWRQP